MRVLKRAGFLVRILCVAATLVCLLAAMQGLFEHLDVNVWDAIDSHTSRPQPSPQIVIVAIDQRSIHEYGPIPWPPRLMARLIHSLDALQPKLIGLDFVYPGEGERKGEAQAESRPGLDELADACRKSGRVVPGTFFDLDPVPESEVPPAPDFQRRQHIAARVAAGASSNTRTLPVPIGTGIHTNTPEISAAALATAHVNLLPAPDGAVRWVPLIVRYREDLYPSFDVRLAAAYAGDKDDLEVQLGDYRVEGVRVGTRFVSTDERGRLSLRFAGAAGTFRSISARDVLAGSVKAADMNGVIALVGTTAPASGDIWATPESPTMPGVEIHANAVNDLLQGRYLISNWRTRMITYAAMLAFGVAGFLVLPILRKRGARYIAIVAVATVLVTLAAAVTAFVAAGNVLGIAAPIAQLTLMFGGAIAVNYVTEERYRKQVEHSFRQYLDHNVINELLEDPSRLRLGGERRDLSVLFCDIRGFTTLSEKLPPETIVGMLNDFFTCMSDVVFAADGLVDKFVGDQIMAFWGAPVSRPNHAELACGAALSIRREFLRFAERWRPQLNNSDLNCGVGVNSGPMIVGNIGSERRLAYTVIGDTVNIAARLEAQNKLYGSGILVGPETFELQKHNFVFRQLDEVRVRGRNEAIAVYELLARRGEHEPDAAWLRSFDDGLRAYFAQEWDEALAHFTAARTADSNDATAAYYIRKLQEITALPEEKRARSTYLR